MEEHLAAEQVVDDRGARSARTLSAERRSLDSE
jgi:hypothetical protein